MKKKQKNIKIVKPSRSTTEKKREENENRNTQAYKTKPSFYEAFQSYTTK